jgi:hypothetical protein
MNEQATPTPNVAPPSPPPRVSIWPGFWLAWAALIGGYMVTFGILSTFATVFRGGGVPDGVWILIGLSPWLLIVGLIVWSGATGRPQLAKGVAIGLASIIGIGLLLFAACFGLLATSNFH